jgi:Fur family transcriptional regulator, ferric uptake regulator
VASSDWAEHTHRALERSGHRASAPRAAVVAALANTGCGASARELADRLDADGSPVGLASVYRALELLEELRLVQRVDVGEGATRYEPFMPDGEHHHHIVCQRCGQVSAFEDPALERAIERLERRVDFQIDAHDVTLRGECPACHATR